MSRTIPNRKIRPTLPQRAVLAIPTVLASLALVGCGDPHAGLYTTTEPKAGDVVGTYVADAFHLPPEVGVARPVVQLELRADGTFAAINLPPSNVETPGPDFLKSLSSGTGKWEKDTMGTLDPGHKRIWGVHLRTPDNRFQSANFTGDKPPYGLIFVFGDPDSGHAVILKRKP